MKTRKLIKTGSYALILISVFSILGIVGGMECNTISLTIGIIAEVFAFGGLVAGLNLLNAVWED